MKLQNNTFLLYINTDNAAFDENPGAELARILRDTADKIEQCSIEDLYYYQNIKDFNGNIVGKYAVKPAGYEM